MATKKSNKEIPAEIKSIFTAKLDPETKKYIVTVTPKFTDKVAQAVVGLIDIEPVAADFYRLYLQVAGPDAEPRITQAAFFRLFDPKIPDQGQPGTEERKVYDAYKPLRQLRKLCMVVGRSVVNGTRVPKTAKQREIARRKNVSQWGTVARDTNMTARQLTAVLELLGRKQSFITDVLVDAGFKRATDAAKAA